MITLTSSLTKWLILQYDRKVGDNALLVKTDQEIKKTKLRLVWFRILLLLIPSTTFWGVGGVGVGGRADKIAGNPIYSNDFLINVGFRSQS